MSLRTSSGADSAGWLFLTLGASATFLMGGMLTMAALRVTLPAFPPQTSGPEMEPVGAGSGAAGSSALADSAVRK